MIESHFCEFYRKAGSYSDLWQRNFLLAQKIQLTSIVLVAAFANLRSSGAEWTVALFAIAILAQLYRYVAKPDEKWWNGRAGAESAKTICWRYVVCGAPFEQANADADLLVSSRLNDIAKNVAKIIPISISERHITEQMREERLRPLTDRIDNYQQQRIRQQMTWYSSKSTFNSDRARIWTAVAILAQTLGLVVGIIGLARHWHFDLVEFFSASSVAVVAWMAVKQFDVLARSYAVASSELSLIDGQISDRAWTEEEWSLFVDSSEEAVSREHTSWRASRGV